MSYFAVIRAKTGFLLGGAKKHVSSRFRYKEEAQAWAECAILINAAADRDAEVLDIIYSDLPAEVDSSNWEEHAKAFDKKEGGQ